MDTLTRKNPPLGKNQIGCLQSLARHGGWPGGWYWENDSTTARILDSLVKRGLVTHTAPRPKTHTVTGAKMQYPVTPRYGQYRINDAGRAALDLAGVAA